MAQIVLKALENIIPNGASYCSPTGTVLSQSRGSNLIESTARAFCLAEISLFAHFQDRTKVSFDRDIIFSRILWHFYRSSYFTAFYLLVKLQYSGLFVTSITRTAHAFAPVLHISVLLDETWRYFVWLVKAVQMPVPFKLTVFLKYSRYQKNTNNSLKWFVPTSVFFLFFFFFSFFFFFFFFFCSPEIGTLDFLELRYKVGYYYYYYYYYYNDLFVTFNNRNQSKRASQRTFQFLQWSSLTQPMLGAE